jgi:phosphoribosyl 1,2-cyclic phosphodiesterase
LTLRFCALASGSRGNALLVEHDDTLVMIDCGLPLRTLAERLAAVGRRLDDVDGLLITHEHGDHSAGIGPLRRQRPVPIWATAGTAQALDCVGVCQKLNCSREISIGSIRVQAFPVPHDAREPCQFVFRAGQSRLGLLTDAGHATPVIHDSLRSCHGVALEFNHDRWMLDNGNYPASVKARVGSRFGHLNNEQAVDLLAEIAHPGLEWVMGLHVSERNNSPARVREAASRVTDHAGFDFSLACQDEPTSWVEIG